MSALGPLRSAPCGPRPGLEFGFGRAYAGRLAAGAEPAGVSARRRRWPRIVLAVAVLAGAALLAQGLWIPAKALLAQALLERAWRRAVAGEARPRP